MLACTLLVSYQTNWLPSCSLTQYYFALSWQDRNVILADEMGLGKTVQCASYLSYLSESLGVRGPFLVVVPLSVVPNWIREFKRWTPMINAVGLGWMHAGQGAAW